MKIRVYIDTRCVGCELFEDIEVDDDADDEEIDEAAKEVVDGGLLQWGWYRL